MRFPADMGIALRIVAWLRENGHDVVHLREEGYIVYPIEKYLEKLFLKIVLF